MRKRITPPVLALLIVLILFTAVSCKDKSCSHVWNDGEITTPATCKEEGVKTYTCTLCGEKKAESVAITSDHKFVTEAETPASCTEKGSRTVKCSICGKTDTEETAPLGHSLVYDNTIISNSTSGDPVSSLVAPTCKDTGKYKQKCTRTGCDYTGEETALQVDSTAHISAKYDATSYIKASLDKEGSIKVTKCEECSVSGSIMKTYIENDFAGTWNWNAMENCTLVLQNNGSGTLTINTYELSIDWSVVEEETEKPYKKIVIVNKTDNTISVYCYFAETKDNGWLGQYNGVTAITRVSES